MTGAALLELIGGLRAAAFLALALLCGAGWGIQTHRLDNARADLASARQTADAAVAFNATLRQTIDELQRANEAWASKHAADLAAGAQAVAAVERERDALQAELRKRRADRETEYGRDPTAATWGRTVVPAGVAGSLRK